jgi:hypothetical protein
MRGLLRMRGFLFAIDKVPYTEARPFETPPAAAPQDKGRVSKHARLMRSFDPK